MNAVFKSVAAAVLAGLSFSTVAANNGVGGYWVNNIIPNMQGVQTTLMQSATGLNYSCGPTSLLFVSNHHRRVLGGGNSPNMSTIPASKATIADIYTFIGVPNNSSNGTKLEQMRDVARNKFGWTQVARMDGTGGTSVTQNMDNLINYLNQDIPAMGVLKAGYPDNPVGNFDHIVVLWGYTRNKDEFGRAVFDPGNTRKNDTIHWYDPYYGRMGTVRRGDWSTSFNMSYFSFLKVGR